MGQELDEIKNLGAGVSERVAMLEHSFDREAEAEERVVAIREDGSLRIEPDDDPYDPLLHKERKEYAE